MLWNTIWVKEAFAIAVIVVAFVYLQFSNERYLRRNGVRVTATVSELPSGDNDCGRCPLAFTIDGEQYYAQEDLRISSEGEVTYVSGHAVDLYVDLNDKTQVVDVPEAESNESSVIFVIVVAALFDRFDARTLQDPVCTFSRRAHQYRILEELMFVGGYTNICLIVSRVWTTHST